MAGAFAWGLLAASSLVLGALVVGIRAPGPRGLGMVMGFGSGVLLAAAAFELVDEAVSVAGGLGGTTAGFFAGAAFFTAGARGRRAGSAYGRRNRTCAAPRRARRR
ncbi:MAG: hypothetical protein KatS3mg009_2372 [Acidimicrobiia bacterium]|nr:MAG: hypothetical protein KatS3mg009_2372 [Acidimicrobiia bacterium]